MDFLPTPPKKWKTLLALASAYYGVQAALPHLFEKKIAGDVAVVTGAGSGIGRLMALKLAKEGCKVALLDINVEAAAHVAAECEKLGATARAYKCNVVDREMVYAVGKQVEADFGRVDIVINNAGIVGGKKLMEADDKRMELTIQVNTIALLWVTKAFLGGMIERDHGHVVTIASSAGRVGIPNMVAYCASKFGAVGFDEALRMEMTHIGSKVKTTCVCPGYITTAMFEGAAINPKLAFLKPLMDFLMPLLTPDYAASSVIGAMKRNQAVLVMPRFAYSTTLLKGLLPTSVCDSALDTLGITSSMDNFVQTRPT